MSQAESIALFYTAGSSDKTYQAQLVEVEGGWKVNAQNGRRGGTLTPQIKTPTPVSYEAAKKIYDSLVKSKKKDGYTEDEAGSVYQDTVAGELFTGIVPQLLNDIREENDIRTLLTDDNWIAQEKYDGERRLTRRIEAKVSGINKTGMEVPLPVLVADYFGGHSITSFLVDGEIIGDRYYLFDLLECDGQDLRKQAYESRLAKLESLFEGNEDIRVVGTARGTSAKQQMADTVREASGEGVVFKKKSEPFVAGKPASGGSQRKWKFTASATVVIGKATAGKRSAQMFALEDEGDGLVYIGKVTIPSNHDMPNEKDLVEVGYLYKMPSDEGCLFQPTYKGKRPDQDIADRLSEFKVKPEELKPQRRKVAP